MALRMTARPRLGPLHFNTSTSGITSVTLRLGPISWRLWSRTGRTGLSSVDLPGPLSWRASTRRRSPAEREAAARRRLWRRGVLVDLVAAGLIAAVVAGAPSWALLALAVALALAALRYLAADRRWSSAGLLVPVVAGLVAAAWLHAGHWLLVAVTVLAALAFAARLRHALTDPHLTPQPPTRRTRPARTRKGNPAMKTSIWTAARDTALAAGALAMTAMALQELTTSYGPTARTRVRRPATAHGWLYAASSPYGEDRTRRLRPATATEAAISARSAADGHGGYLGLTANGEALDPTDPRYQGGAGRLTVDQVETVFVAGDDGQPLASEPGPAPEAAPIAAGELLDEADALLAAGDTPAGRLETFVADCKAARVAFTVREAYQLVRELGANRSWVMHEMRRRVDAGELAQDGDGFYRAHDIAPVADLTEADSTTVSTP